MNIADIRKQAEKELQDERFRAAVNKEKQRLRERRTLWDRIFPFKIIIMRKGV